MQSFAPTPESVPPQGVTYDLRTAAPAIKNPVHLHPLNPLYFVLRAAQVYPDKLAIAHPDVTEPVFYSYATWAQRIQNLAYALIQAGIQAGDRAFLLEDAHHGVLAAHAVICPINFRLTHGEVAYILEHSGAKIIIVDYEHTHLVKGAKVPVIVSRDSGRRGDPYEEFLSAGRKFSKEKGWSGLDWEPNEDANAALCYTSGTTGRPKGVMTTLRGSYLAALANAYETGMTRDSVYLWVLPMFHACGWTYPWAITASMATQITLRSVSNPHIWNHLLHSGVTHYCGAPTVQIGLVSAPEARPVPQPIKAIIAGSAPTAQLIGDLETKGITAIHVYGLTETYGPVTICYPQPGWKKLSVGERARFFARQGRGFITSVDIRVVYQPKESEPVDLNAPLVDVPRDGITIGEIVMRGNITMKEYFRDPEATKKAFRGGYFNSGDLAVMYPDGYISIMDRSKDIIISGGENASSLAIEQELATHADILEVTVVARPHPRWGERPMAFVILKSEAKQKWSGKDDVFSAELKKHARGRLPGFACPEWVKVVDNLPEEMHDAVEIGSKRKRVVSGSENIQTNSHGAGGRVKRRRAAPDSSDEESTSMDVDEPSRWGVSDGSESEGASDSSATYLIGEAAPRELLRQRKDQLVRLYQLAGLTEDAELLTKHEIVDSIVAARDELAPLPPSSPPGAMDSGSSDYSSDGGNVAGGEETDFGRKTWTGAMLFTHLPSPPATRARSRKTSTTEYTATVSVPSTTSKSKGKAKQVEFSQDVEIQSLSAEESDLTDLTEIEETLVVPTTPSPRRLRSQGDKDDKAERRVTPARKAKGQVGSMRESSSEEEEEDQLAEESDKDEEEVEVEEADPVTPKPARRSPMRKRLRSRAQLLTPPSDGDDEESDDESVDITESVDGDGDDEEEESIEVDEDAEGDDDDEVASDEGTVVEDNEVPVSSPRTLRNGKVVGEEVQEDDSEENLDVDSSVEQDAASVDLDAEGDTEEEEEVMDEDGEDSEDIDLTVATAKTLIRLRRDDLVRLCETRELDVVGTKPQLAEALLQWRDRRCSEWGSSPSSTGTARPPSTARQGRRRSTRTNSGTPPVLFREDRVHMDEPRTPPLTSRNKENEPEFELDLGSLGLDDREIPPEKLTKLEKIGSGGFKDVFIGKFKGRKVALAEFRGQLSAMDIKELKLLGDFDHPNIVRFLGVSIPENTRDTPVMIVSELCTNGDLFDYIRSVQPPTLYRALCIMLDIARGVAYLHNRKPSVIHRDCKSSNILITSKGVAKITDFGLAKAPELWHAEPKYNHKVDVFSCALVYWEILQWHVEEKKFPWEGMNEHAIYDLVGAKHQRPSVHGLRKQWCPEIVDLVERMWEQEHQNRPNINEVVQELERLVQMYR
ncbi:hypothetical protein EUX98_g5106 [Antrodiella citrinella]|uniref:Protein kinase domain-containing protein n=1 Tax=Antrodiella citrinella TaxID=2447956 RepID=A0A4S4MSE2_9APHY|nr:hypothetical protein EUX98_g5106 [Antrodiella citrinella]